MTAKKPMLKIPLNLQKERNKIQNGHQKTRKT